MGTLKAKVNGTWTPVAGNPQTSADVARWNSAWGQVARADRVSNYNMSASWTTALSVSFNTVQGRRYRAQVEINVWNNGVANMVGDFQLQLDGATLDWNRQSLDAATANWGTTLTGYFTGADALSHTVNILSYGSPAGAAVDCGIRPWHLVIEDIGPASQVAVAPPAGSPRIVASGNALGVIAVGSFPAPLAPLTTTTAEAILTNPLTFFAPVGRRYRINFQLRAVSYVSAAGSISFYLRDNGNAYRGWQPGGDPYLWVAGSYQAVNFHWGMEGDGLNHSIDVACVGIAAYIYRDYGIFTVEDIGPNSSPALPIPETPPPWTQVTAFQNSWVNYAGSRPLTSYRKIGDVVELRVATKNGTNGAPMFTMPVGFRPPYTMDFMGRDGTPSPAACLFNVNASGEVFIYSSGGAGFAGVCAFNASYSTTA